MSPRQKWPAINRPVLAVKAKTNTGTVTKEHASVDMQSGLINKVAATPADITDAQGLAHICPDQGAVFGDKGYCVKPARQTITAKGCHPLVHSLHGGRNRSVTYHDPVYLGCVGIATAPGRDLQNLGMAKWYRLVGSIKMLHPKEIITLQELSNFLYTQHRENENVEKVLSFKEGTNYDYITMICAGFASQVKSKGKIYNQDILPTLREYRFISDSIKK